MQRGFAHLLLFPLLLLILAVGGGYFYLNSKGREPLPAPQIIKEATPLAESPKPNLDEYSRGDLNFSFVYPKGVTVKGDSEEEFNKRGNGDYRKNFTGYVGYEPPEFAGAVAVLDETGSYDTNPISVWVFNNDNNLTIDKWFEKYWYYPFVWGVFDYTSKGHIALDQEATVSGELAKSKVVAYQPGEPKYIYVSKNSKMYLFRIIDEKDHAGDQILSSFKFLAAEKFCGGIAANLPENQCPEDYSCKLDGNYPDAGGKCVKK